MKALILALVMASTNPACLTPNQRATSCTWRLMEGLRHSQSNFAAEVMQEGDYGLLANRFKKPSAIKIWLEGADTIWIEPHWHGRLLRFYCKGSAPVAYFDPVRPRVCSASLDRREIALQAIKRKSDAVIADQKVIYLPKFFRLGLGDNLFRQAVSQTIASDLAGCDIENEFAETQMRFGESAACLREKLRALPTCSQKRRYDSREFPMAIQEEIAFVTELYWQSAQWRFIETTLANTKTATTASNE